MADTWTVWDDVGVQLEVLKGATADLAVAWGMEQKQDGSWGPVPTRSRLDKILRRNKTT